MRLVIYDLDGTLVDTKDDIVQATNSMLSQLNLPSLPAPKICRSVGRGLAQLVKDCLGTQDPRQIEEGMRLFRRYYGAHLLDHTQLYPGVREVLGYFSARQQAVITNKPDPFSREILNGLGVAGYFCQIIAGDADFPKKPDPTAVLAIMRRSEARSEETLLVGDSAVDIDTGRRAGVFTVGVDQGFAEDGELAAAQPDVLVRDFRELLAQARQRGW
jgi:2-phosphoglycolate phosphatase